MKLQPLFFLAALLSISACEKVIDVDLNDQPPRLVIEGNIEAKPDSPDSSVQKIFLRLSANFFLNARTPVVNTASVKVLSDGLEVPFAYNPQDSSYTATNFVARVGTTYTLQIDFNGERYEATETVPPFVAIDSLYFAFQEETTFADAGIIALIDFQDLGGVENYYWFRNFRNGVSTFKVDPGNQFRALLRDQFFDGQKLTSLPPADNEAIYETGDTATVKLSSISKRQYEFLLALYISSPPGAFDPPPAPIRSNVRNLTNPSNAPLGFFGAIAASEQTRIVPENVPPLP
jgi:hypothetical protein